MPDGPAELGLRYCRRCRAMTDHSRERCTERGLLAWLLHAMLERWRCVECVKREARGG